MGQEGDIISSSDKLLATIKKMKKTEEKINGMINEMKNSGDEPSDQRMKCGCCNGKGYIEY